MKTTENIRELVHVMVDRLEGIAEMMYSIDEDAMHGRTANPNDLSMALDECEQLAENVRVLGRWLVSVARSNEW